MGGARAQLSRQVSAAVPRRKRQRPAGMVYIDTGLPDAVHTSTDRAREVLRQLQSAAFFQENLIRKEQAERAHKWAIPPRRRSHSLAPAARPRLATQQGKRLEEQRRTSLLGPQSREQEADIRSRVRRLVRVEAQETETRDRALKRWDWTPRQPVLDLGQVPLGDDDFRIMAQVVRLNLPLRSLNLSKCYLKDSNVCALVQSLAYNSTIEQLHLRECHVSDAGVLALAEMLRINRTLTALDIKKCRGLSKAAALTLLDAVDHNPRVKSINGLDTDRLMDSSSTVLDLSNWEMGFLESLMAAPYIAKRPDGLTTVNFTNNEVTTDAFQILTDALAGQTTLRSLGMAGNMLDERSVLALGPLVLRNPNLSSIDISRNLMRCSSYEEHGLFMLQLLRGNRALLKFDISGNEMSVELQKRVQEHLAVNRAVSGTPRLLDVLEPKFRALAPMVEVPTRIDWSLLKECDTFFMRKEHLPPYRLEVETKQNTAVEQGRRAGFGDAEDHYRLLRT